MRRIGSIISVRPEMEDEYVRLHANVWPGVLATLTAAHVTNYSIYLRDGFLFSYMEYVGEDYDADMAMIAADPITQQWWKLTDPCQQPVDSAAPGEHWSEMREVFHTD